MGESQGLVELRICLSQLPASVAAGASLYGPLLVVVDRGAFLFAVADLVGVMGNRSSASLDRGAGRGRGLLEGFRVSASVVKSGDRWRRILSSNRRAVGWV